MTTGYSGFGFDYGNLLAESDMNNHQYKFVAPASTAGYFKVATGASALTLGVLQTDPRAGEPGNIRVAGTTKVAASGTINYGQAIKSGSHGMAIGVTASGLAQGIALTPLASGFGYIEVLLFPGAFVSAGS